MSSLDAGLPEPSMVAAVKVMHIFAGIYLWEWASNLEAERDFLLRRRPPRLSLVVYILCRIATLAVICSSLVGFNLHRPFDCEAWFRVVNASVSTALPLCSFLMALRASVIWSRNRLAIITIFSVWLAALGAAIHTSMLGTGSWSPLLHSCILDDVSEIRWGVLTNFIVELAILSIMLFGLLIKHNRHKLWRILYFQGLAWLLAAVVSKVPPLLMSFLNVDRGWNTMFRIPHVVIMGVTSTRVYRELELSDRIKFVFPTFTSPPRAQNQADDVVQISVIKTVDISFDDSQTPRPPSRAYLPGSGFESGSRVIAEDLASQSQLLTEARTSCLSVDDVTNSKLPR